MTKTKTVCKSSGKPSKPHKAAKSRYMSMNTFISQLRKLRDEYSRLWRVGTSADAIRLYREDVQHSYCPITAVARAVKDMDYSIYDTLNARRSLGLRISDARNIIDAADVTYEASSKRVCLKIRARMLEALGLDTTTT